MRVLNPPLHRNDNALDFAKTTGYLIIKIYQLNRHTRHTGRDCRYPEHREVNLDCPPWRLDAFGTSMSLTLRAAKPCKSAVLPICPAIPAGMTNMASITNWLNNLANQNWLIMKFKHYPTTGHLPLSSITFLTAIIKPKPINAPGGRMASRKPP